MSRIARERPDVLARALAGEFVSVRQAAIAAGIVKRKERTSGTSRGKRGWLRY
jgi:hypothetical protein